MHKLITLFIPLLLLVSCRNLKEVEYVAVKGFKINKVNTESIDAEIQITLKNPNNFGFNIYRSEFEASYGGVKLGKARLEKKVHIGKNAVQTYPFAIKGDFKNVTLGEVMKLLESFTRKSTLDVNGKIKIGKLFLKKTFPIVIKEKISVDAG